MPDIRCLLLNVALSFLLIDVHGSKRVCSMVCLRLVDLHQLDTLASFRTVIFQTLKAFLRLGTLRFKTTAVASQGSPCFRISMSFFSSLDDQGVFLESEIKGNGALLDMRLIVLTVGSVVGGGFFSPNATGTLHCLLTT